MPTEAINHCICDEYPRVIRHRHTEFGCEGEEEHTGQYCKCDVRG